MSTEKIYTIRVEKQFEAAHNLREYHGAPEPLHGHTWKAEVEFERIGLDHEGMAIDFLEVQESLDQLTQPFEHHYINELPPFDTVNPSAENIAAWLFDELSKKFASHPAKVKKVIIWEGPRYSAEVEELT